MDTKASTSKSGSHMISGEEAINLLECKEVATVFVEWVDPAKLVPDLFPWCIRKHDKDVLITRLNHTGNRKLVASDLLGAIVERYGNEPNFNIQDLIDALKKSGNESVIEAIENVIKSNYPQRDESKPKLLSKPGLGADDLQEDLTKPSTSTHGRPILQTGEIEQINTEVNFL